MEITSFTKQNYELSVSEVLMLLRCKFALAHKLSGFRVNFKFEKISKTGMLLHGVLRRFAETFNDTLFSNSTKDTTSEIIKEKLYELLINEFNKDRSSSYDIVWNYLENFSVLIAPIVERNNGKNIFLFTEKPFRFELDKNIYIKGRFDAVIRDLDEVYIVDYKTSEEKFDFHAFQIALYYMGFKESFGVSAKPKIFYFKEDSITIEDFDPREVDSIIEILKDSIKDFLEQYKKGIVERTNNKDNCKFCSLRNSKMCNG